MSYFTLKDLVAKLPMSQLIEAMDDDNDGVIDEDVWAVLQSDVQDEIDGVLEQRYYTPIPNAPKFLRSIARVLAINTLYERRGFNTAETNPYMSRASKARTKLDAIADSEQPLLPGKRNDKKQTVQIITEPSRTTSRRGNLST